MQAKLDQQEEAMSSLQEQLAQAELKLSAEVERAAVHLQAQKQMADKVQPERLAI